MKLNNKVFYYPPCHRGGYGNPYSYNFKDALSKKCILLDAGNKVSRMQSLTLLRYSFLTDVLILNWPETIIFNRWGKIQFVLMFLSLWLTRIRKTKVIWMFHNLHPHEGENWYTHTIQEYLYAHANLIVSHSREASEYVKKKMSGKVIYACHPVHPIDMSSSDLNIYKGELVDVLIWGTIYPYKGIVEFISNREVRKSNLRIKIVGKCDNRELMEQIGALCNNVITFENRRVDFLELSSLIKKSRYVLFPYIGDSISSSGALIDTIVLGGTPVGPRKGAFLDLEKEKVCLAYNDMNECMQILLSESSIEPKHRLLFIHENSWDNFIDKLLFELKN